MKVIVFEMCQNSFFCLFICSTDPNAIYVTMDLLMTEDEFFGERIVENFAAFFGIPDENIRVAEYRENGRKRDASFTVSAQCAIDCSCK